MEAIMQVLSITPKRAQNVCVLFTFLSGNNFLADLEEKKQGFPDLEKTRFSALHTEQLTWNLKITCLKRKIIFQTFIFGFKMLIFRGVWLINQPPPNAPPKKIRV